MTLRERLHAGEALRLLPLLSALGCSSGPSTSTITDAGGDEMRRADGDAGVHLDAGEVADAGTLVAIPLTSCDPTVYSADIVIGGSQTFSLLLDTGSATLAIAATGCTACTQAGVSTLYAPGPTAVDQDAAASAGYGTNGVSSGWSGEIYEDWVGARGSPQMAHMKLVAMTRESQFLVGTCGSKTPQGVIGFALPPVEASGTDAFFDQVVAARAVPNVFATRLCPTGGTLWLGGYDPTFTVAPPVYTPMMDQHPNGSAVQAWYAVNLAEISVVGTKIPVATASFPEAMLDTGSSWSSLPPAAFSSLTSAIAASPSFSAIFGSASSFFSDPNKCVPLAQTKAELDAELPPLTLTFGSNPSVAVQAAPTESYLLSRGGQWCPAIVAVTPDANAFPSIAAHLGAPLLASNVVIFDRANQRVGFAPHSACP
jgi:hypothetical protein